jgi:predicted nucleic acid-binding protein
MSLVIDASAAYRLLLRDPLDSIIESNSELIAPDLIVPELLNARWVSARRGARTPEVDSILTFLDQVRIVPSLPFASLAARLSERLGHPIYDCLYVAVARQENIRLLTADLHLERKLRSHKLEAVLL